MRRAALAIALLAILPPAGTSAAEAAGGGNGVSWTEKKCRFYARAWQELLELSGHKGISGEFIAGNEAFIATGCTSGADICPGSAEEGALANRLTMASMNFGTASTFLPFVCRGHTGPLKLQ